MWHTETMSPVEKDPSVGINAAVAAELRAERGAQKITVDALAQRSGIPKRTLLRLLNAERGITLGPLAAITEALDVPMSLVVSRAEERLGREASASAVAVDVGAGGVVVPMRRRGVYGSGQVVEELPEGALERAAAQVVEGDAEDEVEGFGRRP